MMIKGSLLRSIPIVKRSSASENGAKNWGFWGFRMENILTLTTRPPRKSIPTETRYLTQKRCRSMQKCAGPIFTLFGMWGPMADVITRVKF